MAHTNRKICKTLPKQTFDYHSRKCVICRHPDRAAIESASRPSKKDSPDSTTACADSSAQAIGVRWGNARHPSTGPNSSQ